MRDELKERLMAYMKKNGADSHIGLLLRALEMCNDSRNRLTIFQRPVEGWVDEALAEAEKELRTA